MVPQQDSVYEMTLPKSIGGVPLKKGVPRQVHLEFCRHLIQIGKISDVDQYQLEYALQQIILRSNPRSTLPQKFLVDSSHMLIKYTLH
jgi:hypothetical protein